MAKKESSVGQIPRDFRGIELGLELTLKCILPRQECVPSFVWAALTVFWDYWREPVHG